MILLFLGLWELIMITLVFIIPIIALIDILRRKFIGNNKLIWLIVVILLNILGAILYFSIGRYQKIKQF